MISHTLKADIEKFAESLRHDNPLLQKARAGQVTPAAIATYLNSVLYAIQHTPTCLNRGIETARAQGKERLAAYFEHKLEEEAGHERWAESDIQAMQRGFSVTPRAAVPAVVELIDYLLGVLDENPTHYLAYVLFSEYITVLLGPEWVRVLEQSCGIPRTALTVVDFHAELDREHAAEGLREIDELVTDDRDHQGLRETLQGAMSYFSRLTHEISSLSN